MAKIVDFIIVGQGLAGSLLAYELMEHGKQICLIDQEHQSAASVVAAGIINPITGRRFAKSWRIDEFLPFAKQYYQAIEQRLDIKCFQDRSILRFLQGNKDINDWYGRSAWEGFTEYMEVYKNMEDFSEVFHLPFGIGTISPAAQVDISSLIIGLKQYFIEADSIISEVFDFQDVEENELGYNWKGVKAKAIIFCEGQKARFNPLFQNIPFEPAKGEVLFVKIPDLKLEHLLKNKLMIAPLGDDIYWTGSNYEWNASHDRPTHVFREDFIRKLKKTLKCPFEIIDHQAAIRPTIKDRRPVLGWHPTQRNIAIFNGLGTKGASLAPYWAKAMTKHLLQATPLSQEVSINRFF